MKRCPKCGYENAPGNMFCEHCGTALSDAAADSLTKPAYASSYATYLSLTTQQVESSYDEFSTLPPPPPPPVVPYTPNVNVAPGYSYTYKTPDEPRKRSVVGIIFSSIAYMLGMLCFTFGAAGLLLYGAPSIVIGIVFLAALLIGLIIFFLLLIMRKHLYLKSWMRVLITIALIGVAAIALLICAVLIPEKSSYPAYGIIFIIYGFATAVVAFW